jgi:hypothetical protein
MGLFSILRSRSVFLGLGVRVRPELAWDRANVGLLAVPAAASELSAIAYCDEYEDMGGDSIDASCAGVDFAFERSLDCVGPGIASISAACVGRPLRRCDFLGLGLRVSAGFIFMFAAVGVNVHCFFRNAGWDLAAGHTRFRNGRL